jgi:hypothetical protein
MEKIKLNKSGHTKEGNTAEHNKKVVIVLGRK